MAVAEAGHIPAVNQGNQIVVDEVEDDDVDDDVQHDQIKVATVQAAQPTPVVEASIPLADSAGNTADAPAEVPVPLKKNPATISDQSTDTSKWADRPHFRQAFDKVVSILPDEIYMNELLRDVDSTGKERLREMGIRTRQYKKFFEAWEDLHLAVDAGGTTYVRDDVIQYLRAHAHAEDGVENLGDAIRAYEEYRSFLARFAMLLFPWTTPYFGDHMELHASLKRGGRGIVLTAGDEQAEYLLTTIVSFRQLGCTLPIEVMYLGEEDLSESYRNELERLDGVVTRDITLSIDDIGWELRGWAAKPFAILMSSFREVIFIDADALFFRDPAELFEEPGYKKTGALFFKDRSIMPENRKKWLQQILPKPMPKLAMQSRFWTGESGHMQESGVVVVDKWQHFISMLLVTRMNGPDRDGNKAEGIIGVYEMVFGDKETYWIGWLLAGDFHYHFHEGDAGIMGTISESKDSKPKPKDKDTSPAGGDGSDGAAASQPSTEAGVALKDTHDPEKYTICGPQLVHYDVYGKPIWFNGWIMKNKFERGKKMEFGDFKNYLIEPKVQKKDCPWKLHLSNSCCLTSDAEKLYEFDPKDTATLDRIRTRFKEVQVLLQTI